MSSRACAACGTENAVDALFCGRCGTRVGVKCPQCAAVAAHDLAFCTSCGAALGPVAPIPTDERKTVSVLVVDLVGFTARAERLDPEDVRALLAPFHARARADIERFGGTMEKFVGDAVFALFGAPLAHEDDPERAVRAALAVRDAMGEHEASVRIGVTTGEALVSRDARHLEGEGMAAGDVLNTAARLQAAAPPGGILVDEATRRATEHAIEYREVEPVTAKGKAQPVPAWEAVAPRARLGVDIAFRGGAPLVGREEELRVLRDALARARRGRTVQLVTIVGVPGIGKSRLLYELSAILEAEPDYMYWRQGRSLPYGEGVSFWALGEMAKAHAGILESDDADTAGAKLAGAVAQAVPDEAEAAWIEGHLRPLVGLSGDSEARDRREEAFAAWRRFFEALAEALPLVLVFEDLHWADDGLLDFIDQLVEWAREVPLLVVCTTRPELLARRPDWGGGKRNAATISLSPLADDDIARLVESLVGEAQPHLIPHAGGNPLYAEEYARMLAQSDNGGSLTPPDSVQGIIAARLDTLPLDEKALVQDAAVLGKVFWVGELAYLAGLDRQAVDEQLRVLERKEFVRHERRSSVAGETAYVFRHVLVRDVAYGQIPRPRRADKHRLAAEWIETLAGDRREDLADLVAHHYLSALELSRAAGRESDTLVERTRIALRDAGDRATSLNAFGEASRFYKSALGLWPDDEERPRLLFRYGRARFFCEDSGDEDLALAAEELLDAGDRETAAEAQSMIGELRWIEGRRGEAFRLLEGAAALLEGAPPSRSRAYVVGNLARFFMAADQADEAIRLGVEAQAMAESLGLDDIGAHTLTTLGLARASVGDDAGLRDLERGIEIAKRLNSPEVIRGYNNLAGLHAARGELERAFELYSVGRQEAERFGRPRALRWFDTELMYKHYWRGDWDDALALADEFVLEVEAGAPHLRVVDARGIRAHIRFARGERHSAYEDSVAGLEFARGAPDPQTLFPALAFHARIAAALGRTDEAKGIASELLDEWAKTPATFPSFWTADLAAVLLTVDTRADFETLAREARMKTLWLEAGVALARGDFVSAAALFARIGSRPDEAFARLHAGGTLVQAGRRTEGHTELTHALDFFRSVGASAYEREAEALFLAPA